MSSSKEPDTPCIIIDGERVARNIERMASIAREAGVVLRPHVKTHKSPELARMQLDAGAGGVTVAKVSEAEVMADGGVDDIFIAYPLATAEKVERALDLADRCRLLFAIDGIDGARILSAAATRRNRRVEARMEIDTGMRRTGVLPENAAALAAAVAAAGSIELSGIFTFRGSILDGAPTPDRRAAGLQEGRLMAEIAEGLRSAGFAIRDVSVGSTPTAEFACRVPGVTEIRPGTYIFNDRMQVAYGACSLEDCAASILVTVASVPSADRIVVDGGSKTFSTDAAPGKAPFELRGYGEVAGTPDLVLERLSEEHGIIPTAGGHRFRVGERLRIIPNHVCTTINLHDRMWMSSTGAEELRELPVAARGKLT